VTRRDPYQVLGVEPGASNARIKAAWRRLAREHHPDVTGGDGAAARAATRRMAEINTAYETLIARGGAAGPPGDPAGRRRGGPPPDRPTRPVTARLDTTDVLRPRNATTAGRDGARARPLTGQPPMRSRSRTLGPRRASDPNGPLVRSRDRRFRPPIAPTLEAATATVLAFGKFHGHTLGEVAAFEPSYIDWLATTVLRDPDLVAAARVVRDDLDLRGIVRRTRPSRVPPGPPID
jgi:hypothetical protein